MSINRHWGCVCWCKTGSRVLVSLLLKRQKVRQVIPSPDWKKVKLSAETTDVYLSSCLLDCQFKEPHWFLMGVPTSQLFQSLIITLIVPSFDFLVTRSSVSIIKDFTGSFQPERKQLNEPFLDKFMFTAPSDDGKTNVVLQGMLLPLEKHIFGVNYCVLSEHISI